MLRKILVFCFLFFFFIPKVYAANEFSTSYDVTYDVDESGIVTVTEKVSLKNLTSRYFADQFKIIIGATQISDIKASDPSGPIEAKSETKDNSTTISVKFNSQITGFDKILPWTLQFKSKDFAEKQGKVWEIRAPKISPTSNLERYNLTISVPVSFGEPTLISPTPKSQTTNYGKIFLTFDKAQLLSSGVSASFGNLQLFNFDLAYHLENTSLVPVVTSITLPPDTEYQDVVFQRLEPKPINVTVDEDGNYLAWYRLNRNQKLDIKLIGSSKLYTYSKAKNPVLDSSMAKKYTESQKYWEKDNPQIKSKLSEILGDSPKEDTEKVRLIYRYIVDNLKYDPSRLNADIVRMGSIAALNNPDFAVCMEFTDLFIALTRAAGIPARELDGFAYTSNTILRPAALSKDVLHSWPQYWDSKKGWVMVDPTWENTTGGVDYFNKLDLNHFVFAIKGVSSQQPVPAGSFKYQGMDSHDVKVRLSENDFQGKPPQDGRIESPDPILAGFPSKGKVTVTNLGNALFTPVNLSVSASKLNVFLDNARPVGLLPAFGSATFEFNVRTGSIMDSYPDNIEVLINKEKFEKAVSVKPFLVFQNIPVALALAGILIGLIYFATLGGFIKKNLLRKR